VAESALLRKLFLSNPITVIILTTIHGTALLSSAAPTSSRFMQRGFGLKWWERLANIDRTSAHAKKVPRVEITKVEIRPMHNEGNLKAFCSVVFDDVFIVHSVKVIQGKEDLFVAMPSREVKNGEFRDTAHPIDNEFRLHLERTVLDKYKETVGETNIVFSTDIPTEDVVFRA